MRIRGPAPTLISLHMPKAAGTSFVRSLEDHFGQALLRDYEDLLINTPPLKRRTRALVGCILNSMRSYEGVACIHGHFLPLKYWLLASRTGAQFVTWMRDPLERLASQYHHWLRTYDETTSPPLHRRVIVEGWSFERFCFSRELRNTCSQFLWVFPLDRFAFVGISERYEEDFDYFASTYLGKDTLPYQENVNPDRPETPYINDPDLRRRMEEYHAADMALYRRALELRAVRVGCRRGLNGR